MAQKVIVQLLDDVDGTEADEHVQFAVDGRDYEIDLSAANAEKFRVALAPWVAAARRAGGRTGPARTIRTRADAATVRAWAREHGYPDLPSYGRIPKKVRAAYEAAGSPR